MVKKKFKKKKTRDVKQSTTQYLLGIYSFLLCFSKHTQYPSTSTYTNNTYEQAYMVHGICLTCETRNGNVALYICGTLTEFRNVETIQSSIHIQVHQPLVGACAAYLRHVLYLSIIRSHSVTSWPDPLVWTEKFLERVNITRVQSTTSTYPILHATVGISPKYQPLCIIVPRPRSTQKIAN